MSHVGTNNSGKAPWLCICPTSTLEDKTVVMAWELVYYSFPLCVVWGYIPHLDMREKYVLNVFTEKLQVK